MERTRLERGKVARLTRTTFLAVWLLGHAAIGALLAVASLPAALDGAYLLGAVAGLLQWPILRRVVGLRASWLGASLVVGVLLGLPLRIAQSVAGMALAFESLPILSFVPIPVALAVLGAALGATQARALRPHTGSTRPWVAAQAIGLALAGPTMFFAAAGVIPLLHPGATVIQGIGPLVPGAILAGGVGGLAYGAVTGFVMAGLVRGHLRPDGA